MIPISQSTAMGVDRRSFFKTGGLALAAGALALHGQSPFARADHHTGRHIYLSIKYGMFQEKIPLREKFQLLKEMGYDGVELNSPGGEDKEEALKASQEIGLPCHGVVDSIHWGTRLSDPDPDVREKGLQGLLTAIRESHYIGGTAVLLVPGRVADPENENHHQVWHRSIEQIRKALPLASRLGIHILIENVWNQFLYDHDGPDHQSAGLLAAYIDEINSPWVGSYFDIGNHTKYANVPEWIRTLGKRIVKLDVKDWGKSNGFCKIGDGDVPWPEVRAALKEIGFHGWATAEVSGGNRDRIKEVLDRMNKHLLGH